MRETRDTTAGQGVGRHSTGIPGFDDVLGGGFPPRRLYLLQGDPGAGKTTLALQFLLEGVKSGERSLYVTLSETRDELEDIARSHGWSLTGSRCWRCRARRPRRDRTTLFEPAEVGSERRGNLAEQRPGPPELPRPLG
jgi:circadian clock protein KaiC